MQLRWRRTIDFVAFISTVGLIARLKFELDFSWSAAICAAAAIAVPFIVSRLWSKYTFRRTECAAARSRCRQRVNSLLSANA